jgi:hypothetical protein
MVPYYTLVSTSTGAWDNKIMSTPALTVDLAGNI